MADTPYMQLTLPEVLTTPSPTWASQLNTALETIDSHNHTLDSGTQVPIAGLDINDDLDLNEYHLINVDKLELNQLSALPSADNSSIFLYGGELYYRDSSGNNVQITNGGILYTGGSGTITGMDTGVGSPSVVYSEAGVDTGKYTFKEDTTIYADIECAELVLYEHDAGISEAVTIKSPDSLASGYTLTLPTALPASTLPVVLSAAGVLSTSSSLTLTALTLSTGAAANKILESDGSGAASWTDSPTLDSIQLTNGAAVNYVPVSDASGNLTLGKLTQINMGSLGEQISSSCGNYTGATTSYGDVTNLSVTITTTGRPVMLMLINDGSGNSGYIYSRSSGTDASGVISFMRDTTRLSEQIHFIYGNTLSGARICTPASGFQHIDVVGAGTYTYKVQAKEASGTTLEVNYCKLVAFEL